MWEIVFEVDDTRTPRSLKVSDNGFLLVTCLSLSGPLSLAEITDSLILHKSCLPKYVEEQKSYKVVLTHDNSKFWILKISNKATSIFSYEQ